MDGKVLVALPAKSASALQPYRVEDYLRPFFYRAQVRWTWLQGTAGIANLSTSRNQRSQDAARYFRTGSIV